MVEMASSQDANYMYWRAQKQHVMSLEKSGHGLFEGTASESLFLLPDESGVPFSLYESCIH